MFCFDVLAHTENQRVGREDREIGVQFLLKLLEEYPPGQLLLSTYVEKLQLISFAANAISEQEDIALLPGDFLGREFVAGSGGRHNCYRVSEKEVIFRGKIIRNPRF